MKYILFFIDFFDKMKIRFPYLRSGSNNENFYKLIEENEVKRGLTDEIIKKFKKCIEWNNYFGFNMDYNNGEYSLKNTGSNFGDIDTELLTLMLVLSDNVERMVFFSKIQS